LPELQIQSSGSKSENERHYASTVYQTTYNSVLSQTQDTIWSHLNACYEYLTEGNIETKNSSSRYANIVNDIWKSKSETLLWSLDVYPSLDILDSLNNLLT